MATALEPHGPGEGNQRGQWRSHLVAHLRKEIALGPACALGGFPCGLGLGPQASFTFQRLLARLLHLFAIGDVLH
jgi:hypothetical protein